MVWCVMAEDNILVMAGDSIFNICNQRLYLLNLLKKQGLPQLQLQTVFHAILISLLLYAAPAWRGFARTAISIVFNAC